MSKTFTRLFYNGGFYDAPLYRDSFPTLTFTIFREGVLSDTFSLRLSVVYPSLAVGVDELSYSNARSTKHIERDLVLRSISEYCSWLGSFHPRIRGPLTVKITLGEQNERLSKDLAEQLSDLDRGSYHGHIGENGL